MAGSFGEQLEAARRKAGWSRRQLANRLAVSVNTIWMWESGRSTPFPDNRERIVELFKQMKISFGYFVRRPLGLDSIRLKSGLTIRQLSNLSGVKYATVYNACAKGAGGMNLRTVVRLADALGVQDLRALVVDGAYHPAAVPVDDRTKQGFVARCEAVGLNRMLVARHFGSTDCDDVFDWFDLGSPVEPPEKAWIYLWECETRFRSTVYKMMDGAWNQSSRYFDRVPVVAVISYPSSEFGLRPEQTVDEMAARVGATVLSLYGFAVRWKAVDGDLSWRFVPQKTVV